MKRISIALIALSFCILPSSAQQLTRFAVVDLPKVYTVFYRDSKVVRDFEERSARVQSEIDRMSAEVQSLQAAKLDADAAGDHDRALRLETDLYKKSDFLREYYRVKTAELEDQKKKMSQSNSFLQQVYDEIKLVAESEGLWLELWANSSGSSSILWYSPTVDVTDKIIQNLPLYRAYARSSTI
ncbi:OmpH family outer membrane protein [Treponema sp.]